jgi:hypothetical protein
MPPTALTSSVRYFRPETTVVYWVVTITTYTAPTRAQLNAGTNLSGEIAELTGWSVTSDFIDTPDLANRFVSRIPGRINAEDSGINFYASETGADARNILPRDTSGYIVIMDAGDIATTGRMDVFPVTVASVSKVRAMEDPAVLTVSFAITDVPAEDVTIPG